MDSVTLIGVVGAVLLLSAFIANATKRMERDGLWYSFVNFLGAGLLAWYAVLINSWPFIVIETVWALVGLWGVWKRLAPAAKTR